MDSTSAIGSGLSAFRRPVASIQPKQLFPKQSPLEQRAATLVQQNLEQKRDNKSRAIASLIPVRVKVIQHSVLPPRDPSFREIMGQAFAACARLCTFLDTINFYPNYEGDKVHTISVEEFALFAEQLISFEALYQKMQQNPKAASLINKIEEQFVGKLSGILRENGIRSTRAYVGVLLQSNMDSDAREALFQSLGARIKKLEDLMDGEDFKVLEDMFGRDRTPSEQRALEIIRLMFGFSE